VRGFLPCLPALGLLCSCAVPPAFSTQVTPGGLAGWKTFSDANNVDALAFDRHGDLWAAAPDGIVWVASDGGLSRLRP
jgi:hypothetical protein